MATPVQRSFAPSLAVQVGIAVAIVVGIAVGAFVLLGNDADPTPSEDQWATFTDPATGLSVELPGDPATTEETIPVADDSIDIRVHIVDESEAAWSFTVYDLPSDDLDLDGAIGAVTDGIDATVVDSSAVTVSGFPGIDAEATFIENGRDGVVFTRIVMLEGDQTAVILQSLGLESDRSMLQTTFERLVSSFSP